MAKRTIEDAHGNFIAKGGRGTKLASLRRERAKRGGAAAAAADTVTRAARGSTLLGDGAPIKAAHGQRSAGNLLSVRARQKAGKPDNE